jgi:hypothetical protein
LVFFLELHVATLEPEGVLLDQHGDEFLFITEKIVDLSFQKCLELCATLLDMPVFLQLFQCDPDRRFSPTVAMDLTPYATSFTVFFYTVAGKGWTGLIVDLMKNPLYFRTSLIHVLGSKILSHPPTSFRMLTKI